MKINRRNFVKNATIAGIGTAAITASGMTSGAPGEQQVKKRLLRLPISSEWDLLVLGTGEENMYALLPEWGM